MGSLTRTKIWFWAPLLFMSLAMPGPSCAEFDFARTYQSVSTGSLVGSHMVPHVDGDIALSGYYSGSAVFGGREMDANDEASQGFLMRLTREGSVQWCREIRGGKSDQRAHGVAVDKAGNSYVTGEATGELLIEGGEAQDVSFSRGGKFMFVAKYDPDGNLLWAKQAFSSKEIVGEVVGRRVVVDGLGNVYVAGLFVKDAKLGDELISGNPGALWSAFVAKYNSSGTIQWARAVNTYPTGDEDALSQFNALAVDGGGAVTVAGVFSGKILVGANQFTSSGANDAMVVRYDGADGSVSWAGKAGGTGDDGIHGLAVDGSGGVLAVGHFSDTAGFSGSPTIGQIDSLGETDGFLARYEAEGNFSWVKGIGGPGEDAAFGVAIHETGRIAVSGAFSKEIKIGQTTLTSRGETDVFVTRHLPSGDIDAAFAGGGPKADLGGSLSWIGDWLVVGGSFRGPASFGNMNIGSTATLPGGDLFLAILGDALGPGDIRGDMTHNGRVGLEDAIWIIQFLTFGR